MDTKLKNFVITILRRASYKWKPRNNTLKAAKVSYGKYTCNVCKGIYARKDVVLDHKIPVVDPIHGFQGFDEYIERMFVDESGFQVLCSPCHDIKTANERIIRQNNKKKTPKKLTVSRKNGRIKR